jgi:putative transposase
MARQPRIDVPNIPYHVINRAVGRLRIFKSDKDYQLFFDILQEAREKTGMSVLAFVIMPNHWHLVVFPKNTGDLKKFMHLLTNAHTRKVHTITKTNGTGPLYQGRYKSFIVHDDAHLLTVIKYVERNPVRAGLSKQVETWQWGSGWIRLRGTSKQKQLLSEGPTPLPRNYRAWVNTEDKDDVIIQLRTSVNRGTPFGDDGWVNMMVDTYKLKFTTRGTGRPKGSKNK